MDRRERYLDPEETLRIAMSAHQTRIWTALPGIVTKFDATRMTVNVQPTINGSRRLPDGTTAPLQMPVLLDCPVLWQGGGGVTATFPILPGDECLVVFSSRCIDGWWAQSGVQNPPESRMHNLSDGFALVGVRSLPNAFAVDTANACLISDDGTTYFKLNPVTQAIAALAPGGINLNGVTIDASGNLNSPATITGAIDVIGGPDSISLVDHTHSDPQGGTVGPASG